MPLEVSKCEVCDKIDAKFTCPKCEENLCENCDLKKHESKKFQLHKRYPYLGLQKIPSRFCSVESHSEVPLTAFCQNCKKTVCSSCLLTDHKIHNCIPIPTEVELVKKDLTLSITLLQEEIVSGKTKIEELEKELKKEKKNVQEREQAVEERKKLIGSEYEGYIFLEIVSQLDFKVAKGCSSLLGTRPKVDPSTVRYLINPLKSWTLGNGRPLGCHSDGERVYVADSASKSCIQIFNLDGKQIDYKFPALKLVCAGGIDIDEMGMYIIDKQNVYILNQKSEFISSFSLNPASSDNYNNLKVSQNRIYLTLEGQSCYIFLYSKEGKLEKQIGSSSYGSGETQFCNPRGLSVDEKNLYVCDYSNHRIQVLLKDDPYTFLRRWGTQGTNDGQFESPYSLHISEGVVYVGDASSVQLFTCAGQFLQRIGGKETSSDAGRFHLARGICVVNNMLYVAERNGLRVQVFARS